MIFRLGLAILLAAVASSSAAADNQPVRVLVVTGGHTYDTSFYTLFEGYPAIKATVDPHPMPYRRGDLATSYDVVLLYDSMQEISEPESQTLRTFLESGHGLVVLHHALVDYSDSDWWCREVVGGQWLKHSAKPLRWKTSWKHDVNIAAYPVGKHPVTEGIGKFEIHDETYKGMWLSPDIQVVLKTDDPTSDGPLAWISPFMKSRVVAIELGHGREAHLNPNLKRLVKNAMLWAGEKK